MTSIAVMGFGRIGSAVAARLVAGGHRVTAHDIDTDRRAVAEQSAVVWGDTIAAATSHAEIVLTALPGAAELRQAVLTADSVLPTLQPSALWIDLTSASLEVSRECSASASARGIAHLDAPLGGGVEAVRDGAATLYVGGESDTIERARPILETFASTVHHVGGHGSGHLIKLLINTIWFGQVALVTESLLLAQRHGVAPSRVRELLHDSAADSAFVQQHLPALLSGDYLRDFGLDRCVEELEAIEQTASAADLPHGLISAVTAVHREALTRFGPVDGELLAAALLEHQAGSQLSDD